MEPDSIIGIAFMGLVSVGAWLAKSKISGMEATMIAQDERISANMKETNAQKVKQATLEANIEHIREDTAAIKTDVSELLRHANGKRNTG